MRLEAREVDQDGACGRSDPLRDLVLEVPARLGGADETTPGAAVGRRDRSPPVGSLEQPAGEQTFGQLGARAAGVAQPDEELPVVQPEQCPGAVGYPGIRSTADWAIISAARTVLW